MNIAKDLEVLHATTLKGLQEYLNRGLFLTYWQKGNVAFQLATQIDLKQLKQPAFL